MLTVFTGAFLVLHIVLLAIDPYANVGWSVRSCRASREYRPRAVAHRLGRPVRPDLHRRHRQVDPAAARRGGGSRSTGSRALVLPADLGPRRPRRDRRRRAAPPVPRDRPASSWRASRTAGGPPGRARRAGRRIPPTPTSSRSAGGRRRPHRRSPDVPRHDPRVARKAARARRRPSPSSASAWSPSRWPPTGVPHRRRSTRPRCRHPRSTTTMAAEQARAQQLVAPDRPGRRPAQRDPLRRWRRQRRHGEPERHRGRRRGPAQGGADEADGAPGTAQGGPAAPGPTQQGRGAPGGAQRGGGEAARHGHDVHQRRRRRARATMATERILPGGPPRASSGQAAQATPGRTSRGRRGRRAAQRVGRGPGVGGGACPADGSRRADRRDGEGGPAREAAGRGPAHHADAGRHADRRVRGDLRGVAGDVSGLQAQSQAEARRAGPTGARRRGDQARPRTTHSRRARSRTPTRGRARSPADYDTVSTDMTAYQARLDQLERARRQGPGLGCGARRRSACPAVTMHGAIGGGGGGGTVAVTTTERLRESRNGGDPTAEPPRPHPGAEPRPTTRSRSARSRRFAGRALGSTLKLFHRAPPGSQERGIRRRTRSRLGRRPGGVRRGGRGALALPRRHRADRAQPPRRDRRGSRSSRGGCGRCSLPSTGPAG